MAFKTITVKTENAQQLVDITQQVRLVVRESGVKSGVCRVFIPHTTAAVTINENADPNVRRDILNRLEQVAPSDGTYLHTEGIPTPISSPASSDRASSCSSRPDGWCSEPGSRSSCATSTGPAPGT